LAALTGARRGELCGLKWSDVDWVARTVRIERAWVPGRGGQFLGPTKGGDTRTVALGTVGVEILNRYRARKTAELGRPPDGWLLSLDGGTTPMRAKAMTQYTTNLGRRLGIPVHFHLLRHWAATQLVVVHGVDIKTASQRLGHSPEVMASTYLHSRPEQDAAAAELIGEVVGRALGPADSAGV
jgi:integrase